MKIFISDKSDLCRERVKNSLLAIRKIDVIGEAKNEQETLQVLHEKKPDFLIIDPDMPDVDGLAALMKIRELLPECKICILTKYMDLQFKEYCFAAGANFFFDKENDFGRMVKMFCDLAYMGVALVI